MPIKLMGYMILLRSHHILLITTHYLHIQRVKDLQTI